MEHSLKLIVSSRATQETHLVLETRLLKDALALGDLRADGGRLSAHGDQADCVSARYFRLPSCFVPSGGRAAS